MSQGGAGPAIAGLLVAGGVVKEAYDYFTTPEHTRLVKKTAKNLDRYVVDGAVIRTDHGVQVGNGQPKVINGHRPDITLTHFDSSTFLAIEIETADSLSSHAKSQLEAFAAKPNYESVLVVPKSSKSEAEEFVSSNVDADVAVTTPKEVTQ